MKNFKNHPAMMKGGGEDSCVVECSENYDGVCRVAFASENKEKPILFICIDQP